MHPTAQIRATGKMCTSSSRSTRGATLKTSNNVIFDVVEENGKHKNKAISIRHADFNEENADDARAKSEEKKKTTREARFESDQKRGPSTSSKRPLANNAVKEEQKDSY